MSENTNLVKLWAENIKADAETAMQELLKNSFTVDNQRRVLAAVSEIKGSCEAIIAATGGKTDPIYNCSTCAFGKEAGGHTQCSGCLDGSGNARYWVAPTKERPSAADPGNVEPCSDCVINIRSGIGGDARCFLCKYGCGDIDMKVTK